MAPMATASPASGRKIVLLSIAFYLLVGLAETASKIITVLQEYSGTIVASSLNTRLGEAVRFLAPDIVLYVLTVLAVHVLFAVLNGHYTILAARGAASRWPKLGARQAQALAFLAVNAVFMLAVYGLNSALYPASNQAFFRGFLGKAVTPPVLKASSLALLAVYLAGFVLLSVRYARKTALAASLAVWAVLLAAPLDPAYLVRKAVPPGGPAKNAGPNVIFIGLDSLNPLHTGYFGYPLGLTPRLDAFLKENVVFENCYTPIARTFPAWYSILTGQYPLTNGVRLNLTKRERIKSADRCLGHVLKDRGYATVHFTDEVRFSNITPEEGFDVLRHPPMGIRDFVLGSFHDYSLTNLFFNNPLGYRVFPFTDINRAVAPVYDGRYFINDLVTAIGRLRAEERFFLVAHLCIAHWPFDHASPVEFEHRPGADSFMQVYDSALTKVDAQLGRILDALKAAGLYDNSVIVILSDHGESAEGHGSDLRNSEQNRTLLAWKPAGGPAHRDVARLVRTIDIAPTILDLLGLETAGRAFDGVSLKPWLLGEGAPGSPGSESVIMETEFALNAQGGVGLAVQDMIAEGIQFYEFDRTGLVTVRDDHMALLTRRRARAILTPDWKLVRDIIIRGGVESVRTALYDVRADPRCEKDVAADEPGAFQDLWDRLARYYGPEIAPPGAENVRR